MHGADAAPVYDVDFYSDDFIRNPYQHYAAMRALGPIVWLPQHGNFAITRYKEVREVLRHWRVFSSAQGVAADAFGCDFLKGNTLASDPPVHDAMRMAMGAPLLPGALESIRDKIERVAVELVDDLVARGSFDGIADVARFLPLTVVRDLIGLPEDGRENMLTWAGASFDILGIQNDRGRAGFETIKDMRRWIGERATRDHVKSGSWTARIHDLADRGEISREMCPQLIRDYINPSLDTTISATGQLLYQLGRNPNQWRRLRQDPSLIANAVHEAVRLGTPIRSFSRTVTQDFDLSGVMLPAGARIMVLFASANRDDRKFPDPDRFDVTRPNSDHVGFGHGIHMCVGIHLARLEMESLLKAMVARIDAIEVGEPTVALNNTIYAFSALPVTVTPGDIVDTAKSGPAAIVANGSQPWLEARVTGRKVQAANVISLELVATDGRLPLFEPGAHIDIEVASGIVRQYSLCGDPNDKDSYRLGVLLTDESRGGSVAVHTDFQPGSFVKIRAPRNSFVLDESARHSILLAAGIGITPLLSMAYRLASNGASFDLHYWSRGRTRAAFLDELAASPFADRTHLHFSDETHGRRFKIQRAIGTAAPTTHAYVCGPTGFIDDALKAAVQLGWAETSLHVERFGGGILKGGEPFLVVAERSGLVFEVSADKTILEAALEKGIVAPSSCQTGVCGTCLTNVIEGVPDHRDLVQTTTEKASNRQIAVCCSRAFTGRLVLDL